MSMIPPGTSIQNMNIESWSEVYNRVIGAVVFIDEFSAECLHWEGGLFKLMEAGAAAVKSLSPFEVCQKQYQKAVFITQATAEQLSSIEEIITHSDLTHCILISCVSLDLIILEVDMGKDVSDIIAAGHGEIEGKNHLEELLYEWIGNSVGMECLVDVVHAPILAIQHTNVIFTTPPYQAYFPLIDGNLSVSPISDLYQLPIEDRVRVRRIASGLNSIMSALELKEDVYYMGAYSSLVAGILENYPVSLNRRKNGKRMASLIIIDRTLDMAGVTSYSTESVLDKITTILPRFPGHGNGVAVDMSTLCQADTINHPLDIQLSPGSIYHARADCKQTYDHMINKSQKEVMLDLYNKLCKIDVEKSPSPKNLLKVTPQSIEKIITSVKGEHIAVRSSECMIEGNYKVIEQHLGVIQQALAIVQTLKSPGRSVIELLQSLEKQVLQSLTASKDSTSVLYQITHLIRTRRDRNLPIEHLLALIIHVYSLSGSEVSFSKEHEENLMETLSVAIFEDNKRLFLLDPGQVITPEDGVHIVGDIMTKVKEISMMRKAMQKYNSVIKPCEGGQGEEYKGLLQQLVEDLVNTDRPEMPDLSHRSEGIKDLLLSGFNMLTNKKRVRASKHPLDNPLVIIYVIGGMTAEECKRLHRTVITSGVDNTVLFGSTRLITPVEAMRDLFMI